MDDLAETIEWLRRNGSSVSLNWGEDTSCWECSWITGGERFTGVSKYLKTAIGEAIAKVNMAKRL